MKCQALFFFFFSEKKKKLSAAVVFSTLGLTILQRTVASLTFSMVSYFPRSRSLNKACKFCPKDKLHEMTDSSFCRK